MTVFIPAKGLLPEISATESAVGNESIPKVIPTKKSDRTSFQVADLNFILTYFRKMTILLFFFEPENWDNKQKSFL